MTKFYHFQIKLHEFFKRCDLPGNILGSSHGDNASNTITMQRKAPPKKPITPNVSWDNNGHSCLPDVTRDQYLHSSSDIKWEVVLSTVTSQVV